MLVLLSLSAIGLFAQPVLADCTPGQTRCGADSEMESCNPDHTWNTQPAAMCSRNIPDLLSDERRYNFNERGRGDPSGGNCTTGISRCGADGQVERCTDSNTWSTEPGVLCSR
jgi:hypothetical protein